MGQQDTGDEEEEEEEYSQPPDNGFSGLNGLPNVPPSLTISLTPAPSQAANGSSIPPPSLTRMPALIRVSAKRSSQDSTPPPMPPLVRKSVGKRQRHSLDSSILSHIKFEDPELKIEEHPLPPPPRGEIEQGPSSCGSEEGLDGGWAIVAEQLRQANNMAEIRTNNLTNLMEQQIKLQKQGLKMQKRMLSILEQMHPMQSAAGNINNTS